MSSQPVVEHDGNTIIIRVSMDLKKRSGRKQIIVPAGPPGTERSKSPSDQPLLTAIARACHWQELLDSGRYASITELAVTLGLDRSYVGKIVRLTLLAPDIVASIVRGDEPSGLSLERLTKRMPVLWEEQRRELRVGGAVQRADCEDVGGVRT